ncbi:NCS2 family permease [Helicobacter pylori]|uniref:NCS2 family permease n=1 Tax=Helicobacter pylori TaxID=210 RepID=UPI00165AB0BB|nr:NCS2 family permease [Helicobacter pylori]MBH0235561.1 NCS2 family permease [Helicobacter pylori]MBH0251485.1 NCS2 family permease [Helicobacter pylori]MBH0270665.1 NCS2 family permease [Helicobacter pylori]
MGFFKLKEHNTNIATEFRAGLTTFITMIYIVPLNALILSHANMPYEALLSATAIITILSSVFNGLWANTPIAMSVGLGLSAYFSFGLVQGLKLPWQSALGIVALSGAIFVILSFTKFRSWVMRSIPSDLRRAVSAGIGAFIAFIGLKEMHIVVTHKATLVTLGDFGDPHVLLGVVGIILTFALYTLKIRGSFIIAVLITSTLAWVLKLAPYPSEFFSMPASIGPIAFQLDFKGIFFDASGAFTLALVPVIITFFVTDLFDSLGTLAGIGHKTDFFNDEEKNKELEKTLEADAVASLGSAVVGVSTTTAFIESASGVEEGGRTGLTAVFTGLFFVLTLFCLPLLKAIPSNAIYPVLVVVGVLMFSVLEGVNFKDMAISVSTFLTVVMMPLTFSIADGLAFGFLSYSIIKLVQKDFKALNSGIIILCIISVSVFIFR